MKSHPGRTRTHQITQEHNNDTCSIIRGSTEALKSENCRTKSSTNPRTSLKPPQITFKAKLAGTTAPVNNCSKETRQVAEKRIRSYPGRTRTHQITQEHIKNTYGIIRGPTEVLISQKCNTKSSTQPKGTRPRHRSTNQAPEPQRQDHARRSH